MAAVASLFADMDAPSPEGAAREIAKVKEASKEGLQLLREFELV
jgi:hypothetical protein